MSVSLPSDVLLVGAGALEFFIYEALREFIEAVPKIAREQETKINGQMAGLSQGVDFFGLLVEDVDAKYVTLLKTFNNVEAKYPDFSHFPPKVEKIEGLKIDLLQVAAKVEKHVNLTDSRRAVIDIAEVVEVTVEIQLSRTDYAIQVGGGVDKLRNFEQYLVHVDLNGPPLHFHGYLATSGGGGLLIKVHSALPVPIPLGTSCFALTGVGMLYGERFAPWVSGGVKPTDTPTALAALGKATAEDYVNWAQKPDLNQWLPVDQDLRIFGLTADVGDVGTAGRIVELQDAGLTFLSYGPTVVFGGKLNFLESNLAKVVGAIDLPSQSMFLSLSTATLELIPEIKIAGSTAVSASLVDQSRTWAAIGGYDMKGCLLDVLDLITLNGGFRVVPFQGAAARGEARVQAEGRILGIEGGYSFYIALMGSIGWNPVEIGGQLDVGGSIWVKIWGTKLGAGIDAHLALQIARPLELRLWGEVSLDLPWPLSPLKFPVEIFDFHDDVLASPIAGFALGLADPVPFYFAGGRLQGQLGPASAKIWPDVTFDLPFRRLAAGPAHIVNRASADSGLTEAGVTTSHAITRLDIMRVDQATGAEQSVGGLFAAWMATSVAEGVQRTSRLAFPSNDPLAWLQSFSQSQPAATHPVERFVFQTFGAGRDEVFTPNGGPAGTAVGDLQLTSRTQFRIANLAWTSPYPRALTTMEVNLQAGMNVSGSWLALPVGNYDVRLISRGNPSVRADGLVRVIKVRDLEGGFAEWSAMIERAPANRSQPVAINGLERTLVIPAVGYTLDETDLAVAGTQTILQPGIYRLYIEGHSDASYRAATQHLDWTRFTREFRVVPPDTLRPYLRYATFGDERIFRVAHGGWNPNPDGQGFGHYVHHEGVLRSRVGYLSKIYDRLWIATKRGDLPVAIRVTPCSDNSVAGGKLGAAWPAQTGGQPAFEEELRFQMSNIPGAYEIEIFRSDTNDGQNLFKIDGWTYRISSFASPTAHLKPRANTVGRAFGPFGTRHLSESALPDLAANFDIDGVRAAGLIPGWALPKWVQQEPSFESANLGLTFLRLFEWCGFFEAEVDTPEDRITSRPSAPTVDLLMDRTSRPLGIVLRTAEPVDWRRVEATMVQGDTAYDRRFEVRLFPSPDGCSAVLLAVAGGLTVRLPKGQFAVRILFQYRLGDLPSLVDRASPANVAENFTFTFAQVFGRAWNV